MYISNVHWCILQGLKLPRESTRLPFKTCKVFLSNGCYNRTFSNSPQTVESNGMRPFKSHGMIPFKPFIHACIFLRKLKQWHASYMHGLSNPGQWGSTPLDQGEFRHDFDWARTVGLKHLIEYYNLQIFYVCLRDRRAWMCHFRKVSWSL